MRAFLLFWYLRFYICQDTTKYKHMDFKKERSAKIHNPEAVSINLTITRAMFQLLRNEAKKRPFVTIQQVIRETLDARFKPDPNQTKLS